MASLAIKNRNAAWLLPALTLTALYVFPVVLIATGIIPFHWRFAVLLSMTLVAAGMALARHSRESLGLTLPRRGVWILLTAVPAALLAGLVLFDDHARRAITPAHAAFYLFFVFVSAPAQEFLYRSFLFAELAALNVPPRAIVILSAVLFGFMHIIYRSPLTVALTLSAGLIWAIAFHATRKVCVVAVSHALVGAAAIFAGII